METLRLFDERVAGETENESTRKETHVFQLHETFVRRMQKSRPVAQSISAVKTRYCVARIAEEKAAFGEQVCFQVGMLISAIRPRTKRFATFLTIVKFWIFSVAPIDGRGLAKVVDVRSELTE